MTEIVVLGAGPAGLMAALEAARAGHRCTVLEASPRVGGMAGSFEVGGQRVDYGSHRLHPATPPPLLALISDLLGPDLQVRPRSGRIHLGGRWVGFPLRAMNLVRTLPPSLTAALVADSLTGLTGRTATEPSASFHHQVTRQLGRTVADRFYGPFATKLYGVDSRDLSGELARRRVSATSAADIAQRLIRARKPAGRTFYYPRRGYGQISERLAEAAVDAGAVIELQTPAQQVSLGPDRATVITATAPVNTHEAAVVLSTIPVTNLAAISDPPPPPEVRAALAGLRTRAMILVYVILDRPRYTDFDAHYIPGPDTTVARLSEPKNYRDGDDPPMTTVLCAEIACWTDDEIWSWDDARLAELVVEDLTRIGLPPVDPAGVETRRLRSVYPVYDIATESARATVDRWHGDQRLLTLGRQGLRAIDNLHHVLEMGRAAVETIGGDGAIDDDAWRDRLDRFTLHTVED